MSKKIFFTIFSVFLLQVMSFSQTYLKTYQIFDAAGKPSTWKKLLKKAIKSEVIFFGEYHDDPIIHFLQLRMLKDLSTQFENLALGLEMIEFHDADVLNAYLNKEIDSKTFLKQSKSLWPNFKTDYKPMVDYCREKGIHVFASNVPRQLASEVYRKGFEALDSIEPELSRLIPPLPIPYNPELPGYRNMLAMKHGHGGINLPKAQAFKDASMAWSVIGNIEKGMKILHLNGTYHTNNFEGIIWYVNRYRSKTKYMTIAMVRQKELNKLNEDYKGLADFVIAIPEDMIRTH